MKRPKFIYDAEEAEADAEALLEGPMCRSCYTSKTREAVAEHLSRLVQFRVDLELNEKDLQSGNARIKAFRG